MKEPKCIYLTIRVNVEADIDKTEEEIVQELDCTFSSFDDDVYVVGAEICGIND